MQSIKDIKIVGIDMDRAPLIRKESYIDLFFKLSQKAPDDWCEDFNTHGHKIEPGVKINKKTSIDIETWVRDMEMIPGHLEKIKKLIVDCNQRYIEKIRLTQLALAAKKAVVSGMDGKQNQLNEIIAALNFEP